jgi:amidohydrolase
LAFFLNTVNFGFGMDTLLSSIDDDLLSELVRVRRHMHRHPELSGQEKSTAAFVAGYLKEKCSIDELYMDLGGHGLVAVFDSAKPGASILFRAELDALPIQEVNLFDHTSCCAGVSHKCGHDGHAATLLGLGLFLSKHRPQAGKVLLLFQPAEETGRGAEAMMQDPAFIESIKPDLVFAFHNIPGYPLGSVMLRRGAFTASVKSTFYRLHGKTSHAAEPENGVSPALCIANLLLGFDAMSNNDLDRTDFRVITPVHVSMGEVAYGVAAGYGEVHLTSRTWTEAEMARLEADMAALVHTHAEAAGLTYEVGHTDVFRANESDDAAVEMVRAATVGAHVSTLELKHPMKWGEDFGLFSQRFRGCFFGIGSGENRPALHNPDYDYPDEILSVVLKVFVGVLHQNGCVQ